MKTSYQNYLFIILFTGILFLPFLGNADLFDWDEINFAEAAREMIVTGDYLTVKIDFEPFHEKPPLFIWCQVISMKIFGVNEFAARLPNAVLGITSMVFLFQIGKKLKDEKFGLLFVLAYSGSILPFFYFKTGLIDPLFNFLMFVSLWYFFKSFSSDKNGLDTKQKISLNFVEIIASGLFCGLAVLTKGPVGYLLVVTTYFFFWIWKRKFIKFPIIQFLLFTLLSFLPIIIWYMAISYQSGTNQIAEFLTYQIRLFSTQDAGHGGPIYYHLIVLLFGVFPSSVFALQGFKSIKEKSIKLNLFSALMFVSLLVVIIIFSIVKTKIVHYSSFAYYPIAYFAASGIYSLIYQNERKTKYIPYLFGTIGIIFGILATAFLLILINIHKLLDKVSDKFTFQILSGKYYWDGFEWVIGAILLIGVISGIILYIKNKRILSILTLYFSTTIFSLSLLPVLLPRILQYTQDTPINFIKHIEGKDCYVQNIGYKSFAPMFYLHKKYSQSAISKKMNSVKFEEWLLNGKIDRDVYFIAKYPKKTDLSLNPNLQELYEKNGWIFFYRKK